MSDPKTYTDDFAKFADRINRIEASIRNLRVPTDGQFTQTVKKILALFDSLDQQVADSISKNSYDKATIDSKLQDWNWGTLTPGRGGTGTTNGYNNLFTKGQWRAGWILTDGTIGTAQSSRKVKTDITDADQFIPIEVLRKVKWQIFRYIADLNANNDSAMPRIGMIAEDLDSNGLGMFCTYDANDEPDGIDYQTLSVAALRLAQDAETRIDDLAQRLTQLEKRNQQ